MSGVTNGFNTLFTTPSSYAPGSLVVFLNGQALIRTNNDGWIELGGNRIQMKIAPTAGDDLQAYYLF